MKMRFTIFLGLHIYCACARDLQWTRKVHDRPGCIPLLCRYVKERIVLYGAFDVHKNYSVETYLVFPGLFRLWRYANSFVSGHDFTYKATSGFSPGSVFFVQSAKELNIDFMLYLRRCLPLHSHCTKALLWLQSEGRCRLSQFRI